MGSLPDGYLSRGAAPGDLDGVVALMETLDRSLGLEPDPNREELNWLWHLPSVDLERDTRVVTRGEAIVGYADAMRIHPEQAGPWDVFARVHPDHHGRGIGSWLAAWNEHTVRTRGAPSFRTYLLDRDEEAKALMRSRGYVEIRSTFTMCRALDPDEDPGSEPAGVTIRPFRDGEDDRLLHDLEERSFQDHWGHQPTNFESWNEALRAEDWDPSLVWIAEAEGTPAGFLVAFLFETCGFVGILGVLREFRGRGIGTALLQRSFGEFARRGRSEVRLAVDAENTTGAVALYERDGMRVCRRYDAYDLGTQEARRATPNA